MTFTGTVGKACMFPLNAIIKASVALGISPNALTAIGMLINYLAASRIGRGLLINFGAPHLQYRRFVGPSYTTSAPSSVKSVGPTS